MSPEEPTELERRAIRLNNRPASAAGFTPAVYNLRCYGCGASTEVKETVLTPVKEDPHRASPALVYLKLCEDCADVVALGGSLTVDIPGKGAFEMKKRTSTW